MSYSLAFKQNVVRRVLPPNEISVQAIASETGVAENTIYGWLKKARNGSLIQDGDLGPHKRGSKEKLVLLLEEKEIPEDQKGEWLRRNGLHSEHLHQYEQEITELVTDKTKEQKDNEQKLKDENKKLKKELEKREKALLEMATLLTLKKKLDAALGEDEDE